MGTYTDITSVTGKRQFKTRMWYTQDVSSRRDVVYGIDTLLGPFLKSLSIKSTTSYIQYIKEKNQRIKYT